MIKVAIISAILETPLESQKKFNELISSFSGMVKGRMGIPMPEYGMSVITITIVGSADEINKMTGQLGQLKGVHVKTSISKKEVSL